MNRLIQKQIEWLNVSQSTVQPRYLELGHLELPAISNRLGFPLDLPLFSPVINYAGCLELGDLEHLAITNSFSLPLAGGCTQQEFG